MGASCSKGCGKRARRTACALILGVAHLLASAVGSRAEESSAEDRKVAEAGREGLALLREVQCDQAKRRKAGDATASSGPTPATGEAAGMRGDIRRAAKARNGQPASNGGARLTKGICNGCGG